MHVEKPKVCVQDEFHPQFSHTTHTSLQVCDNAPESPLPDSIEVKVFDPSKNISVPIILKSTDTTEHLMKKYLQFRPELVGSLHLAYNGKRVSAKKTMGELGVKPGAMFITFQRCIGG